MSGKLRDLIRAVRACKTAAQERETIAKECAALVRTPTHPHPHAQIHSQPTRCGQTASKLLARGSESVRSRGKVSAPWQSLGPFLVFLRLCEMNLALRLVGHALIPGSEPYSMRQAARGAEIRFRGEARA